MLSNFIVRVSMGTVRDYYRPDPSAKTSNKNGIDLCYLLTHHDSFQWSPNAEGTWRVYFVFVISNIDWGCNLVVIIVVVIIICSFFVSLSSLKS